MEVKKPKEKELLRQANQILPEHKISDEIHLQAGKLAQSLMNLPPKSRKETKSEKS